MPETVAPCERVSASGHQTGGNVNSTLLPGPVVMDWVDEALTGSCPNAITESEVREEEARICRSTLFCANERVSSFLSFLLTAVLNRNLPELEVERTITELRVGRVLRWEAKLLQDQLTAYYGCEGQNDPLIIEISAGDYVPAIYRREVQKTALKPRLSRSSFEALPVRNLKNRLRYSVLACLAWARSFKSRRCTSPWLLRWRTHRCQGQRIA